MNVGIIGCGLIGHKRARAVGEGHQVVAVADPVRERADRLASQYPGCTVMADGHALIDRGDVDLIVVATTNDALAALTRAAAERGKHVIVEKPAARSAVELAPVIEAARHHGVVVKVGFNHRFHPAFLKARQIWDSGVCGPHMFIRGRYGHGGRLGMEREWRGDISLSGGGEMLDQGVHLIDLSRWFLGEIVDVQGRVERHFWDWPVEDNGFALLRTAGGSSAWLHASCTEWKNLFSFEIYGRSAKLQVDGLGGSYGTERLTYYQMRPELGPPDTISWEYPGEDTSWRDEFTHVVDCICNGRQVNGGLDDAVAALQIVERLYDLSELDALRRTQQRHDHH